MVQYITLHPSKLDGVHYKEAEVTKRSHTNPIIQWQWDDFRMNTIGRQLKNPPSDVIKALSKDIVHCTDSFDTDIVFWYEESAKGTFIDNRDSYWKPSFRARHKVYATFETKEVSMHGLVTTSEVTFTIRHINYDVYYEIDGTHIGEYKSKEQVRKAVNKFIEEKNLWKGN